jgi:arylsulfatase A-like enzyme
MLSAAGLPAALSSAVAQSSKPNILFVILDDVGIDQLQLFGFGGTPAAATPNLAKIAQAGVKFTNVWAMPECSPSRAAFFTGRYPIRTGVTSAIVDNHLPQEYVSEFEATLPRVLAKAGYTSSLVGKYHLGNEKDPAGNCAPLARGWQLFRGNMTAGPPSIDKTAGGGDPNGAQACGYYQTSAAGACYHKPDDTISCRYLNANAQSDTSPSRTCLQSGGIFRPNKLCNDSAPVASDFDRTNAYYVWNRIQAAGAKPPSWTPSDPNGCLPHTVRRYMTTLQSSDGSSWWNTQSGPRMLTLSYNTMHTPYQKAPTFDVPDPLDQTSACSSLQPERPLLNNMIESADAEIGSALAAMGLGTVGPDGHTLQSVNLANTVVVIVGDNGSYGSSVRVTDGFSVGRSKATVYQTGVWVPLIVAGGFVQSPGREVAELINVTDLFQFFGDVAGLNVAEVVPPSHQLDSKALMPYLLSPSAPPVRTTSYTEVAAGKFTPVPSERSWPCQLGNICNDTLLFSQNLCLDNGGIWYGPGAPQQVTSCCAVAAANSSVTINPVHQFAVRNKRFKLVETQQTNCAAPLPPDATNKPFPWAEYDTKTAREFYDIRRTTANPSGMDIANADFLKNCPEGQDPLTCLPGNFQDDYTKLSNELDSIKNSAAPQQQCRAKGDGNGDLRVNQSDLDLWSTYNGKGPSVYDINMDGVTDQSDQAIIQANFGTDCMSICQRADLDRNSKVNANDLALLRAQFGKCEANLCGGDLNGDGRVDQDDVTMMQQARQACTAPSTAATSVRP